MTFKPAFEIYIIPQGYLVMVNEKEIAPNFTSKNISDYMAHAVNDINILSTDDIMAKILKENKDDEKLQAFINDNVTFCRNIQQVNDIISKYI